MRGGEMIKKIGLALVFGALVVVANWLTSRHGLVAVGFGLMATAGTWAAGAVLVARDLVHDVAGRWWVFGCIVIGAVMSGVLTGPQLGIASGVAFLVSEVADWTIYAPMRRRGWARAVLASSIVGALVDSVIFLALAGFSIAQALAGQMYVKGLTIGAVVVVGVVARALFRNRVRPESA